MQQPKTILIIDSDESIRRKMFELLIKEKDYEVLLVIDGNGAIKMIRT